MEYDKEDISPTSPYLGSFFAGFLNSYGNKCQINQIEIIPNPPDREGGQYPFSQRPFQYLTGGMHIFDSPKKQFNYAKNFKKTTQLKVNFPTISH